MLRVSGWIVAGVAGMLAVLELVLRLLPVSTATLTGYHVDPLILSYPPGHRWQVSTGWDLRNAHRLRANNLGFAAERDFVATPGAVALVGDSYVEASMLDASQRPAEQLAAALGNGRPVYGLGGPGSALLDYAERIRLASQRLGVRDFVVLMEAGDVRQSLCGSGNAHGPCLDRRTLQPRIELHPEPGFDKKLLRDVALAQYVFGQLKVQPRRLLHQAFGSGTSAAQPATDGAPTLEELADRRLRVQAVSAAFFERIAPYATGRLVLVVDGRREAELLRGGLPLDDGLQFERDEFIRLAREHGAQVVDAEDVYRAHWARSSLSLVVGPYDRHLNAIGVGLLMRAAAQSLHLGP
jgi:hypothetical protein